MTRLRGAMPLLIREPTFTYANPHEYPKAPHDWRVDNALLVCPGDWR